MTIYPATRCTYLISHRVKTQKIKKQKKIAVHSRCTVKEAEKIVTRNRNDEVEPTQGTRCGLIQTFGCEIDVLAASAQLFVRRAVSRAFMRSQICNICILNELTPCRTMVWSLVAGLSISCRLQCRMYRYILVVVQRNSPRDDRFSFHLCFRWVLATIKRRNRASLRKRTTKRFLHLFSILLLRYESFCSNPSRNTLLLLQKRTIESNPKC